MLTGQETPSERPRRRSRVGHKTANPTAAPEVRQATTRQRRRWPRHLVVGAGAALGLFALLGFFVVPPVARHVAQRQLGELLGRRVTIDRIRVNPFALSASIEGLHVFEPDGTTPFVDWRRLHVDVQASSAFRRALIVREVTLDGLRVHVVRVKATHDSWADVASAYNFSDIVARLAAPSKTPAPPASGATLPRFSLSNLRLSDASVTFDDRPLGAHHEMTALSIGVPFLSTLPVYVDSFVEPGLHVRVDGTPFSIVGRTKPFKDSRDTVLELRLRPLDLTRYLPFLPAALPLSIDSALLSLALDLSFVQPNGLPPRLTVKGQFALTDVSARQKGPSGLTPLAALKRLEVRVGEADITNQKFAVDAVALSGLDLHVRRGRDGTLNVQHLGPADDRRPAPTATASVAAPPTGGPGKPSGAPAGPLFTLARFTLDKTTVHFADEGVRPRFEAELGDVRLSATGLSNIAGATANLEASLRAAPGGEVKQRGTLRLVPFAAAGTVQVEGMEPARFAPYTREALAFDIAQGRVRAGTRYEIAEEHGQTTARLRDAFVELSDLALQRPRFREPFFRVGQLAVRGAQLDLGQQKVHVTEVVTTDASARVTRDAKGIVDLTTLVPGMTVPAGDGGTAAKPSPANGAPAGPAQGRAWLVEVERVGIEKWGARFEDRAVTPPAVVNLTPITVRATNVSTAPGTRTTLDVRVGINKKGRLQVAGSVGLDPLAATLKVDLKNLQIVPLQPYFREPVNLTVTNGTVSMKGQTVVKAMPGGVPRVGVTADVDVTDLATVDDVKQERLLSWKALHVGGLKVSTPPLAIALGQLALTDLDAHLVVAPDGRFNLAQAFAPPGAPAKSPPRRAANGPAPAQPTVPSRPPAPGPTIAVGQVVLRGGAVSFDDRSLRPSYAASLTNLAGTVSGLSSTLGTTAAIDLRGTVNDSGALTVLGKINPLAKDLFVDMRVDLQDFELPPVSPYSGKYVGYTIRKGKLDLALGYKIAVRRLDASNKIVIDQLTFGDKVESADAVKAPVRLAVALLKDRHGVIDLDVPVAGSLDDPKFKIWRVVVQVLVNLVAKAATAPFSLIASAFGGDDDLSRIEFAPGLARLDPAAGKRLEVLAKAMRERPGLAFEIAGQVHPAEDREGLQRFLYERTLKKLKMDELLRSGAEVRSVDDLTIEPAERQHLVGTAYAAAKFSKPKNFIGFEKSLPPAEQEKLLLATTRVDDDQLRDLALRRATAVQAVLSKAAPDAAHRLFLVTARGESHRRVELKLKP